LDWDPVSADHKHVVKSGLAVVSRINDMLKENGLTEKCATLELKKVKSAIVVTSKKGGYEKKIAFRVLKGRIHKIIDRLNSLLASKSQQRLSRNVLRFDGRQLRQI
jgi:predicted transcriptional regulator